MVTAPVSETLTRLPSIYHSRLTQRTYISSGLNQTRDGKDIWNLKTYPVSDLIRTTRSIYDPENYAHNIRNRSC